MKKNLPVHLFRAAYLLFYFLAVFQSKIVFADSAAFANLPLVSISESQFTIKAPAGWKVRQHYRGKTLVFEDPTESSAKGVSYSRNITVALKKEVRPIDAMEVQRLSKRLVSEFSATVGDFEIIEARIIDYRGKSDAILVFTTFTQNAVPMRQMHIFTSGSSNSALITYTDLQDAFEADGALDKVWSSMMSAELKGDAPSRYDGLMYSLSGMACMGSAAFLGKQLRRRQAKANLRLEEDVLFEDDEKYEAEMPDAPASWQLAETRHAGQAG